jgi:hypothetical protein
MARTRCAFTQETVKRLLKAAVAAGARVRIKIQRDGTIELMPIGTEPNEQEPETRYFPEDIVL